MEKESAARIDLDIRFFRRYPKEAFFAGFLEGRPFHARVIDYSLIGVGILIEDPPVVNPGDTIVLDIEELDLHETGKIAWTEKTRAGLRVGVLKTGPLRGSLRRYPLPDIFIGLQRTSKTGILAIHSGPIRKEVHIRSGEVIFAVSNYGKDGLGEVLLKNRKINERQYKKSEEIRRKTGASLAEILVHMGYLKQSEVLHSRQLQVGRIIGSLFAMRDAEFEFLEGPLPSEEGLTLNLPVANLMFRALKKNADVELLEHYLLDRVVAFSPAPLHLFQDMRFSAADRAVLACVDGKTTIRDICLLSPYANGALKTVYALLETRLLELRESVGSHAGIRGRGIPEREGGRESAFIGEIHALYAEYAKMDYYHILGLDRDASVEKIKKAYYRAAKKYHPDLHLDLPEDTKTKLLKIFTYITNAYLTLTHPQRREEYHSRFMHGKPHESESPETSKGASIPEKDAEKREYDGNLPQDTAVNRSNAETAGNRFREGKDKFKRKEFDDAVRLFATAIYFDGSVPEYHYFYGRALAARGDLKEATKALNRANELKPMSADILAELGHVYMDLGFPLRAKGYFDRALKYDPSSARAKEGIDRLGTMQ